MELLQSNPDCLPDGDSEELIVRGGFILGECKRVPVKEGDVNI